MLLRFAPVAAPALSASFNGFDGRCQGWQRRRGDKVLQNLPLVAFRLARFALGRDPADHVGEGGKFGDFQAVMLVGRSQPAGKHRCEAKLLGFAQADCAMRDRANAARERNFAEKYRIGWQG
jgi:hypothetical protein